MRYNTSMQRRRGRPVGTGKDKAEKYVRRLVTFPPEVWEQLVQTVPTGYRSAFISEALLSACRDRVTRSEAIEREARQMSEQQLIERFVIVRDELQAKGGKLWEYARDICWRADHDPLLAQEAVLSSTDAFVMLTTIRALADQLRKSRRSEEQLAELGVR